MSNEKFKVKFGLAVGDTVATVDGTTGNIVTTGDIAVNGGDVTTTSTTGTLFNTNATTVNIAGAATNVTIASTGGSTQIRNALTVDASASVGTDLTVFGGDIITTAATASVFNTGATTLNIGGAATTVGIGATTGTTTVKNSLQVDGNTTLGSNTSDEVTVNANNITFSFNDTATPRGLLGQMSTGAVDYWFIGGAETGGTSDVGYAMIATGDNGNDPIYARQYNGSPLSGTIAKELTLLDASGNTSLAGDLTVGGNGYIYSPTNLALDLTGADVRVAGDLTVDGGDLITANTTSALFNTTATTLNIGGAATTVSIGANTGTTTINNSLVADDISIATVDATNIEVTNIKAKDGTAAMTIADTTGAVTVSTQLSVDNINISGNSIISTDTNGNITLAPNGTGSVVNTFSNGGNLSSNRNIITGAIRNATTASTGDIWALNATGPVGPLRGMSVDNSGDTTRASGYVARTYNNTNTVRSRIIFERARGTAASPTAVQAGDFLGEVGIGGYSSTGWTNDTLPLVPAFFGFNAVENWVSNTNLGATFTLSLLPSATTATSSANNVAVLTANPQGFGIRSDAFGIGQGKTTAFVATGCSTSGTTLTIGTVTSGTVAVGQLVQTAANLFNAGSYIVANISGSGSGSTWTLSSNPGTLSSQTVTGQTGYIGAPTSASTVDAMADLRLLKNAIKGSGGTTQIVTSSAGATLELRGDNIQLENAAGSALTSAGISYTRTYGEVAYTNAAGFNIPAQNTIYTMPLDTTLNASGVSIANTGDININVAGWYKIIMSLQATSTHNGVASFVFWLRKNGSDVANSKTEVDFLKDQKSVISMDWLVNSDGNDYWEIVYATASAAYADIDFPTIAATATPYVSPLAPALIVNVIPAGM